MKTLKFLLIAFCLFGITTMKGQRLETDSLALLEIYLDYDQHDQSQTQFIQLEKTKIKCTVHFDRSASPQLIEAVCKGKTYSFSSGDQKRFTSSKTKAFFVVESISDDPRTQKRHVLLRLRNAAVLH
ncbi:MAG: hypothetical protein AAFV80_22980 [Bacteroidota bacterium]